MQRSILSQILDTTLGPGPAPVATKPANSTLLNATPKPSNYTAPQPANDTLLGGSTEYIRRATPVIGTQLAGNQTYISGSANLKATLFGAGAGQTYAETSFNAAAAFKPPVTRQPIAASLGFAGGGVIPGGSSAYPPAPPITNGLLADVSSFLQINSIDKFII